MEDGNAATIRLLLKCPETGKVLYWRYANGGSAYGLTFKNHDLDMMASLSREKRFYLRIPDRPCNIWKVEFLVTTAMPTYIPGSKFGLLVLIGRVDIGYTALGPFLAGL